MEQNCASIEMFNYVLLILKEIVNVDQYNIIHFQINYKVKLNHRYTYTCITIFAPPTNDEIHPIYIYVKMWVTFVIVNIHFNGYKKN